MKVKSRVTTVKAKSKTHESRVKDEAMETETNRTRSTYEIKENTHKTKSTRATRTPPKTGARTRCTGRDGHTIFVNRFSMTTV